MKSLKLTVIGICFLFTSCTTSKLLTSGLQPAEIKDVKIMEPYSNISVITKGNRGERDDSASFMSGNLIIDVAEKFKGQVPLTGSILLTDPEINGTLKKEYESLIIAAQTIKDLSHLQIPPTLDKVLEANDTRFGMITVASGFTRVRGNYGKEIAKGALLGLVTLGMYYQTPIKSTSNMHVIIVDSQNNNVAFYRRSFLQDKEPLDEAVLMKQFKDIFTGYFISQK